VTHIFNEGTAQATTVSVPEIGTKPVSEYYREKYKF
jgi:hypothetical protein